MATMHLTGILTLCLFFVLFLVPLVWRRCTSAGNGGPSFDLQKINAQSPPLFTERYGRSLRGEIGGIPVLLLRGSYEEMGEAQGSPAGRDIIDFLDKVLIPYVDGRQPNAWDLQVLPLADAFVLPAFYRQELSGLMRGIQEKLTGQQDRMLSSARREISLRDLYALNCIPDIIAIGSGCRF
jgi:hypothetical protein